MAVISDPQTPVETAADRIKAKHGTGPFACTLVASVALFLIVTITPVADYFTAHDKIAHSQPQMSWSMFTAAVEWKSDPARIALTFPTPTLSLGGKVMDILVFAENGNFVGKYVTHTQNVTGEFTTVEVAASDLPGYVAGLRFRFRLVLQVETQYGDPASRLYGLFIGTTVAP